MNINRFQLVCCVTLAIVELFIGGCGGAGKAKSQQNLNEPMPGGELGPTVGAISETFAFTQTPVEGFSLVGALNETGSTECPPQIREYLEKYLMKQLPDQKDVGKFIDSPDTAVVIVYGIVPPAASKNQRFDIAVAALQDTETSSLEGGILWGADLSQSGQLGGGAKVLAKAEGPVFIDTIDSNQPDKRTGYILGGGKILDDYKIRLVLRKPDYQLSNDIRNVLNGRFGSKTAIAVSPSQIDLNVPPKYKNQKERFIKMVRATYLTQTQELNAKRIDNFIAKLGTSPDKEAGEIALEAIGRLSLEKLASLLNSSNEEVRLRTSRCMLNLGSDEGLNKLRQIAMDEKSSYRIEAIEAVTAGANRNDAAAISRKLLRDKNFDIRIAAYKQLEILNDIVIREKSIADNFQLVQIDQMDHKGIFVTRNGQPRIVLFGSPIYFREGSYIQSRQGNITINAPVGEKYVTIMRKHPRRPSVILQLKSSYALDDIIETLCGKPLSESQKGRSGLGVPYSDAIALLKQMCDKGAIEAEFKAGALPKIGQIIN